MATDQRVQRTCYVLKEKGFTVILIGRRLADSPNIDHIPFKSIRVKMLFTKGPLFYFFYNVRLFFLLVTKKADLLISNDLDTLIPNFIVSKIKGTKIIYDSHEIFTEVPELQNSKFKKKIWEQVESLIIPRLNHCITVNQSIANYFQNKYNVKFHVIRNIPIEQKTKEKIRSRNELNLPENKKIILLQGSGINIDRGAEELVEAMQHVPEDYLLLIIGGGDVISILKKMSKSLNLESKIIFLPKMSSNNLFHYTCNANLGVTLDKDTNLNYRFSLPNKIFDYIYGGIPVLSSRLPEIEKIILKHDIGTFIENHNPVHIAERIQFCLNSNEYLVWISNINETKKSYGWDQEKKNWDEII